MTKWNFKNIFNKGGKKGRAKGLQARQSHLCAWHGDRADPAGNYARAHGKQGDG